MRRLLSASPSTPMLVVGAVLVLLGPVLASALGLLGAEIVVLAAAAAVVVVLHGRRLLLAGDRTRRAADRPAAAALGELTAVVWCTDLRGRWTYLSDGWTRLTGRAVSATLGQLADELVHVEDLGALTRHFQRAMEGEVPSIEHEHRMIRADGRTRWVELRGGPRHGEDGELIGAVGTLQDVTDRHEREVAFRHVAELARELPMSLDARAAICAAAADIADAPIVVLMEHDGDAVQATAQLGCDGVDLRIPDRPGVQSQTLATLRSGEPKFIPDARSAPMAMHLVHQLDVRSACMQPVRRAGETVAILAVAWTQPRAELPDHVHQALALLGDEASAAIERADLLNRLSLLASTDPLTGVLNRRGFDAELAAVLSHVAQRPHSPVSVVALDLDHFKAYNDTHGHPAGDAVLTEVAHRWRDALRAGDVIGRTGGEEFVVLLRDCDAEAASRVAGELRALTPATVTASAGVASARPSDDAARLLARADEALYAAKRSGRDRTVAAAAASDPLPEVVTAREEGAARRPS